MTTPTTHADLLATYISRCEEGYGFLLAGELDEAAHVIINGEPALSPVDRDAIAFGDPEDQVFRLEHNASQDGCIKLRGATCELLRFGCLVSYYRPGDLTVPPQAIEAAFIELLDGARPSGGAG
jgi:hypothetical protein